MSIDRWYEGNSMKRNPDKYQAILRGKATVDEPNFKCDNITLPLSSEIELLGVTVDFYWLDWPRTRRHRSWLPRIFNRSLFKVDKAFTNTSSAMFTCDLRGKIFLSKSSAPVILPWEIWLTCLAFRSNQNGPYASVRTTQKSSRSRQAVVRTFPPQASRGFAACVYARFTPTKPPGYAGHFFLDK